MAKDKIYSIGAVELTQLKGADIYSEKYSDSDDAENLLFDIFSSPDSKKKVEEALSNNPVWPIYYHLSPYRKNVIDWFEFGPNAEVLEIGAGCGAVTESLCSKDIRVTALELTKRRAEINAHRNTNAKNLKIVIGNLEEYKPENKFDYIVCVGVLEYAGLFIDSDKPYEEFIAYMSSLLKSNGQLIIAIENRLGLKYLSGAREDHTGGFFDGINQYPKPKNVQTFGRSELKTLIESNGFKESEFYYPYPDYKMPSQVYSNEYCPGENTTFPIKLLPTKGFDAETRNRIHLFSEQLSMLSIEKNHLYRDLSNSFIVVAGKDTLSNQKVRFFTNTPLRKQKYQIKTYLGKTTSGKLKFYKSSATNESKTHLKTIEKNAKILKEIFKDSKINVVTVDRVDDKTLGFDYIEGDSLEHLLFEAIAQNNFIKAFGLIDDFISAVGFLPGKQTTDRFLVDLNFDNIIVDKNNQWHFIDYEWLLDKKVDKNLIVQRSLFYFINRYSHAFMFLTRRGNYISIAPDWYLPREIYERYEKYLQKNSELASSEKSFQMLVNSGSSNHPIITKDLYDKPTDAEPSIGAVEEYFTLKKNINYLNKQIRDIEARKSELEAQKQQLITDLENQRQKTRKAELTSPYHLTKKVSRRIKRNIRNGKLK